MARSITRTASRAVAGRNTPEEQSESCKNNRKRGQRHFDNVTVISAIKPVEESLNILSPVVIRFPPDSTRGRYMLEANGICLLKRRMMQFGVSAAATYREQDQTCEVRTTRTFDA